MIANEIQIENLVSIEKQLFCFRFICGQREKMNHNCNSGKLHFTFQVIRIVVMQTMTTTMMKASGRQIENKIYF